MSVTSAEGSVDAHCGPINTFKSVIEHWVRISAGPGLGPVTELIKRDPYVFSLLLNFLSIDWRFSRCSEAGHSSLFVKLPFV